MYYDPMLAKLIVWGEDRPTAVKRMQYALKSFAIGGVQTNIPLLSWIASNKAFISAQTTTSFFDEKLGDDPFSRRPSLSRETLALATAAALQNGSTGWRLGNVGVPIRFAEGERTYAIEVSAIDNATRFQLQGDLKGMLTVHHRGPTLTLQLDGEALSGTAVADADGIEILRNGGRSRVSFAQPPSLEARGHAGGGGAGALAAPMPGRIIKVAVQSGDHVAERALLMVLEAMKMEHRIEAPSAGTIKRVFVKDGELVTAAAPLVEIE
jgi:acetyl/propionyl-CoA carboxylase alpha subunit